MTLPGNEIIKLELKPRPWVVLGGMGFSMVLLIAIAWSLPEAPFKVGIFTFLFSLVVMTGILRWRREPRLQVTSSRIRVLSPAPWSTPLQNISHILLASSSGIHFQFQNLDLVETGSLRRKFQENMERFGWHCELPGPLTSHGSRIARACNIVPEFLSDEQSLEQSSNSMEVFHSILAEESPNPIICKVLVGINVLVFLVMAVWSGGWFLPDGENLLDWGANFGPFTFPDQPWRLLTSAFIHIGLVHLGINMLVLYRIGPFLELILGRWDFLVIYLASGIGGGLASVWWNELGVSAGASGALFGMFGGLLGYLAARPPSVPMEVGGKLRSWALQFIVLNIVLMSFLSGIDQAAHVGGAISGMALGLTLGLMRKITIPPPAWFRHMLLGGFGAVLLFGCWFLVGGIVAPILETFRIFEEFGLEEKSLQDLYLSNFAKARNKEIPDDQFADLLDEKILPAWRAHLQRFESIEKVPAKFQSWFPDFLNYIRTQIIVQEVLLKAIRTRDSNLVTQYNEQSQVLKEILETIQKKRKAAQ